jgi:AraC family transcriptional regulator
MIEELFASRLVHVSIFRCPPGAPEWREVNEVGERSLAVFPETSVVVGHVGREPVLANRNHVMFFGPGQRYRRRLHDPRGDVSVRVAPEPRLAAELAGAEGALPFVHGPCAPEAYLARHKLVRHLRGARRVDRLYVEETLCHLLARVVADGRALHGVRERTRPATRTLHHELVEEAKGLLTERPAEPWTLTRIARELHTSEFHLARIFRATTGFTLHGYRNQLRLRLALDFIDDAALKLVEVASLLGFSSHSHFTDSFGAAFGVPPSAVRGPLGRRSSREVEQLVEGPAAFRF